MAKKPNNKATIVWLNDRKTVVSPVGVARFPYINKPSTKFEPVFKTDLIVNPNDKDFKAWMDSIRAMVVKAGLKPSMVDDMIKEGEDKDKNPIHYLSFKTNAKPDDTGKYRPPTIFNSANAVVNQTVWGGDLIRVGFRIGFWKNHLGSGLKFYLGSVQLLKKNSSGGSTDAPFESDDEYTPVDSIADSGVNPDTLPDNTDEPDDSDPV